jgi:hypothetical protein
LSRFTLVRAPATSRKPRASTLTALVSLGSIIALTFGASSALAATAPIQIGNAAYSFGGLASSPMTNAGLDTIVGGDVGSSTSIDVGVTHPGFAGYVPPSIQLTAAQAALLIAFGAAEAAAPTGDITGVNLAGATKLAGVYNSTGSILISGPIPLTLDGGGNADSVFIFQAAAAGDLTVAATSSVSYTNGAQPCNVFWKVQSAFLANTGNTFIGTILALTQITLTADITVQGRLLARNADVSFDHDVVTVPTTCVTQASINAAAAAAAAQAAAAQAAAAQAAAAAAAAEAAKVEAARAAEAARVEAARLAAEKAATAKAAADKAAADAAAAATAAQKAAADAAAAAEAVKIEAARVAAEKAAADAATARAAAVKAKTAAAQAKRAAQVAAAKVVAARKKAQITHAKRAIRRAGFTG